MENYIIEIFVTNVKYRFPKVTSSLKPLVVYSVVVVFNLSPSETLDEFHFLSKSFIVEFVIEVGV